MKANRLKIKDKNNILATMPNNADNIMLLHRVFDVEFEDVNENYEVYTIH